ncbi:universal stress protein [Natronoarchaeum sp. GCM10025703]|uniref:universal stress protein n=1 Tax=Natronoarchaeum sp. GCM10025703 TaxID=3252685 RepID=UPI00361A10EB
MLRESATILPEDVDVDTAILRNDHVGGAITDETAKHDLTILGATRAPFLRRKLVGSIAEGVGRSAASEVIIVRRALEER